MSDLEFTSIDFEKYNTNTLEEKSDDDIDQIALASARALLDNDENNDMDWSENTSSSSQQTSLSSDISHPRKLCRITTNAKKAILDQLFEFEEKLPETAILKVLSELQTIFLDWTAERVKQYLRNNCHKVQK
ncbi:4532_t:CDS:2 [Funneliformis caledonium]|uniref:4532_t:CDS:1 n=1 Tax=Funneliformis caledonium TaxID=1117310 RepID=A0A9N9EGI4_9GLOM|nr:4532_t:CDS:2 [Funneliformis caledonium]